MSKFLALVAVLLFSTSTWATLVASDPPVAYPELMAYVVKNHPIYAEKCARVPEKCVAPVVRFALLPQGTWGVTNLVEPYPIYISVYVPDDLVPSVIVHEYVHLLQARFGDYVPKVLDGDSCATFGAEWEAYTVSDMYMVDHNLHVEFDYRNILLGGYAAACAGQHR